MIFFPPTYTREQIEAEFKKWSKILHPDKPGGDTKLFQELQKQKDDALQRLKNPGGKKVRMKKGPVKMVRRSPVQNVTHVHINLDPEMLNKGKQAIKNLKNFFDSL